MNECPKSTEKLKRKILSVYHDSRKYRKQEGNKKTIFTPGVNAIRMDLPRVCSHILQWYSGGYCNGGPRFRDESHCSKKFQPNVKG